MWSMPEHQFMMGLTLNLPIQFERQQAQISEARAQLGGAEAQREQRLNKIRVEVREAVVRFDDAQSQESLYRSRILPAARRQVSAAKAEYQSGRNSFAALMKAERQLKALELEYQQVFVDTWRRRALLARAVGSTPGLAFTKGAMQ